MILECTEKEKKIPSRTSDFEEQLKVRETTAAAETTDLNMWKKVQGQLRRWLTSQLKSPVKVNEERVTPTRTT